MQQIRVGTIVLLIDGVQYSLAGDFTLNPGVDKKDEVIGPDGSVGEKVTPQAAVLEGMVRDTDGLDVKALLGLRNVSVTAQLANGKGWVLPNAFNSSDGNMNIAEGFVSANPAARSRNRTKYFMRPEYTLPRGTETKRWQKLAAGSAAVRTPHPAQQDPARAPCHLRFRRP